MQFITRLLIVLAVLGGLGYGSYAFGKYVLSARLFGPQGANSVTAASAGTALQEPPEVEVVPAPQPTAQDDDVETSANVARPTATPDARVEIVPSQNDDSGSSANRPTRSRTDARAEPTPRPRRRRRARPTPRPTSRPRVRPTRAPVITAPPARTQNVDPPSSQNSSNSDSTPSRPREQAPRIETPRRNDPEPAPTRRRRERRTNPETQPRDTTPNVEAPRPRPAPERRRESVPGTSPIPVPEGAPRGGGDSPIPVPG